MHPPLKKVVPVAADMVTVSDHPQGKVTSAAKFFRDEDSRTRIEHGDNAVIHDPVKGESYVLKMPEKIAIPAAPKPELPAPPPLSVPSVPKPGMPKPEIPQLKPPAMPETDLGEKTINGMKVQGKRFTPPQAPPAEVWTSPELKLPIQSTMVDPKTGAKSVTEMKNIQPGVKLDPAMFQVPKDFKIAPPLKPPKPPAL